MPQNLIWTSRPIFISSTFSDMNAERDVLRDLVSIDLQDKLNERRVRLEPIDFRWGIDTSNEKETEQKELMVLKVCLDDIERSKPFFIGLIGDRYGWIPPEKRMKDAEKEKKFESKLKDKSVTALEIEYGVLESKDQLKRSFFFFRETLPGHKMTNEDKEKYCEQDEENVGRLEKLKEEIRKSGGDERVYTYKVKWDFIKNQDTGEDEFKIIDVDEFKKKVAKALGDELDAATKALERTRPKSWEEEEQNYLQDFIADRVISFEGRDDVIKDLKEFALSESGYDNWGKCVAGESGSGKSALTAKLFVELSEEKEKDKDIILLAHAAGISLRSNSLDNMLTVWIKELAKELSIDVSVQLEEKTGGLERQLMEHTGLDGEKTKEKSKFEDLKNLFANLLSQAAVNKRVVVLVDALNQFDRTEQAKYVSWLPELVPQNSKFIFTAIPGEETENLSKRKGMAVEKLEEIKEDDAGKIIKALCERYHKTFNAKSAEILLKKKKEDGSFAYSNPLWLTMVIDDFLLMDEDDFGLMKGLEGDAEQKLAQLLIQSAERIPADVEGMYQYVFKRCRKFGEEFVNEVLSYIGISRNGLRDSDLESLINEYANTKWEALNFASFRKYLRNHIIQKGALGLWDFRHVKARESLMKGILKDESNVIELHKNLSTHLDKLNEEDPLRLTEIIWHLFKCNDKEKAAEIYGSYWSDQHATNEYSMTLKDIIVIKESYIEWVSSLISIQNLPDSVIYQVIHNVQFSLDEIIKDFVKLNLRLELFKSTLAATALLIKRNSESIEYARELSVAYDKLGNIYLALGNTNCALENYKSSLKNREEIVKHNPNSAEYKNDLTVSFDNIGHIYSKLGDTQISLQNYESSLNIRKELYKLNPYSDYFRNLSISYDQVGDIYATIGNSKRVLENYDSSLKIREALRRLNPDSVDYARILSFTFNKIGNIHEVLGQTKYALENYEKSFKIDEELYKHHPDSVECAGALSSSYDNIGRIYNTLGDSKTGLMNFQNSLKIREMLYNRNPELTNYVRNLSVSYWNIGEIYTDLGDTKTALENYENSLKICKRLNKLSPDSAEYMRGLSLSYNRIGYIYELLKNNETALENYENSLKLSGKLQKLNPSSTQYANDLSVFYKNTGNIYDIQGNTKSALENYENSLKICEHLCKLNPDSLIYKRNLISSYYKIGSIYTSIGDTKNALENYENSLKICKDLYKLNPDSDENTSVPSIHNCRIQSF